MVRKFSSIYLRNSYLNFILGKNHFAIGREVLCLDSYVKINLKGFYDGPVLSEKMRKNITKFNTCYIPARMQKWKLSMTDRLTLEMQEEIDSVYGASKLCHVLPHYQLPDIVLCFDKNGKPVTDQILDCFPPNYSADIISKELLLSNKPEFKDNMDDYTFVTVIIGGWNLLIRNTNRLTGGLEMKLKQLELIGHRPVLMFWSDWIKKHPEERAEILHTKIKNAINNIK